MQQSGTSIIPFSVLIVSRLGDAYGVSWFPEDGELIQVQFSLHKDQCDIFLDTSGSGLHKRGYRANSNAAPLRETLAAAMLKVARWRGRDPLIDPFCGSGTIPIEAAMIAMNRAPGLMRSFDAEKWPVIGSDIWTQKREEAIDSIRAQSFTDWELILCDDGSSDDTLFVARRYARLDERIHGILHRKNRGLRNIFGIRDIGSG